MKLLLLFLILFGTLFSAEIKEDDYLGSSYKLDLALEPSCLSLIGSTQVVNKHLGVLAKFSFCDSYLNDEQDYLQETYSIGTGISLYSNDIYRDSFFISFVAGIERLFITDVFTGITGDGLNIDALIGLGYQWQFKRGYTLSLGAYALYTTPITYKDKSDAGLKEELSASTTKVMPTFLVGWRF